ncbi:MULTISPECIES: hypothetical protein [Niastella]|uniref:Lipocalin-like domain-containing protein n=1 Tax=Niastella soli TaxID=2821487 RepID=A0ABS3Z2I5_9BACT|nr:hypothetical protein [Niastella soli]MBO9204381.1 hypothetical protein [Niastella soli]
MNRITLSIALLLVNTALLAQTDFSGKWQLKEKQHILGPEYANAVAKLLSVDQRSDSLIIESSSVGENGQDVVTRSAIALNGKQSINTSAASNRKLIRSLQWSNDKKTLTITTAFYMPGNDSEVDFTRVEVWTLENGQLKVDKKSIETRSETWEVKAVFEK